ncbi:MAG: sterol desaturase family protein [Chitinophagales bacterium]|nr:sterol desaturase family protein [Bacteroidota bacterium]MCB9042328.1 sterol desaturase family protein [Chitinophagales bacterium]
MKYIYLIKNAYTGYAAWLWNEILHPSWHNYFYWLIGASAFFFLLELLRPWRKNQAKFRKDFWLDFFYMFFNFFLFSLIIYNAASEVVVNLFRDFLGLFGIKNLVAISVASLPVWVQLLILFVVRDFIQWNVHRWLHSSPRLWEFHKVHHSVEEMGFAAHLRYHWMENIVYNAVQYLPLAMIGFGIDDFFVVYIFGFLVGHFNHSNITVSGFTKGLVLGAALGAYLSQSATVQSWAVSAGMSATIFAVLFTLVFALIFASIFGRFLGYIFNSPEMHIWHHAYDLPPQHTKGINFGLTLSCWDYIFGTAYIPYNGRDIRLGFPGMEKYPHDLGHQLVYGFGLTEVEKEEAKS